MNRNTKIVYWSITGIASAFILMASIPDITRSPEAVTIFTHLGYPLYLLPFLGTLKIAGVAAILIPRFPKIKEWAYAGLIFDLVGAAYSHISVGDGADGWAFAIIGLVLVGGSYFVYRTRILNN
jgi:uncharacterized membrane protein YphA (DoxX/SURF4 family)